MKRNSLRVKNRKTEKRPKLIELSDEGDIRIQYKCEVCDKIFLIKSNGTRHLKIHRADNVNKTNSRKAINPKKTSGKENRINEIQGWPVQGGAPSLGKRS